jgi:hypothetical protein
MNNYPFHQSIFSKIHQKNNDTLFTRQDKLDGQEKSVHFGQLAITHSPETARSRTPDDIGNRKLN